MTDSTVNKYVNRHTRPHIKWSFLILIYQQPKTDTKASSWGEVISMVPVILPKEGSIFFLLGRSDFNGPSHSAFHSEQQHLKSKKKQKTQSFGSCSVFIFFYHATGGLTCSAVHGCMPSYSLVLRPTS